MKDISLSRRAVMLGAAALPMAQKAVAQARPKPVVVSSANSFNGGMNCCAKAMEVIKGGGDTLDGVIAGREYRRTGSARYQRGLRRTPQ